MKKDQNLPNKNIHSNNSSGKPLPNNSNYSRNQSPHNSSYKGRSPEQKNSRNFSQNIYSRSNSQNNQYRNTYSRSSSNRREYSFRMVAVLIQTLGIDTTQTTDHKTHHIIETKIILTIEMEAIQIIEISIIKTTYREKIHTTDQIIKDPMIIIIKIDHETIHKIEVQTITINKKFIPNLLIGIITVTPIPNTSIEATNRNIKDKLFKYKQLKKQLQTPWYR